ncbi:MAG: hypothetical protein ACT4OE_10700 [Sphingosinicella sp.]
MTDASTARDELSYVRQLAESGARAPLLAGRFMVWWGLLVAIAWTLHHLALNGRIGDGESIFGFIWTGFGLVGLAGQLLLARTMRPRSGEGSAGNRASRSAWASAALAIGSVVIGGIVAAGRGANAVILDITVPVAFSVYACALVVTGSLAGDRTVKLAGGGALVMAGAYTALILHPDRYLVAAAGAALTVMLPGLLLLSREPRAQD